MSFSVDRATMEGLQTIVDVDFRQIHGKLYKEITMYLNDLKIELKIQGFLRESVICAPVFSFSMGFLFCLDFI